MLLLLLIMLLRLLPGRGCGSSCGSYIFGSCQVPSSEVRCVGEGMGGASRACGYLHITSLTDRESWVCSLCCAHASVYGLCATLCVYDDAPPPAVANLLANRSSDACVRARVCHCMALHDLSIRCVYESYCHTVCV